MCRSLQRDILRLVRIFEFFIGHHTTKHFESFPMYVVLLHCNIITLLNLHRYKENVDTFHLKDVGKPRYTVWFLQILSHFLKFWEAGRPIHPIVYKILSKMKHNFRVFSLLQTCTAKRVETELATENASNWDHFGLGGSNKL